MVMILPFKEMLKGNVRTYMNGKVARQKKEVWLRVHALLFPKTKSLELFSSTDRRLKIKRTKCIHSIEKFFIEKGG